MRAYRLLLRLLPSWFRARYEEELLEAYRTDRARPRFRGPVGRLRFWMLAIRDVLGTAVRERREPSPLPPYQRGHGSARRVFAEGRDALRGLLRAPGFLALATVTLGLGIGSAVTVFAAVDGVLLTPLDFPEPERLVRVWERERENPDARMVAYGNYADLRDESDAFESLAIWRFGAQTLTGAGDAVRLRMRAVSASFARTLGVAPVLGRWLTDDEEETGARVVVLGDALWRARFGEDPTVVGRAIRLEGEPYEVVGVMPSGFEYPSGAEAWIPLEPVTDPGRARFQHTFNMVGRLRPGLDPAAARRRLEPLAARLAADFPDSNADDWFDVQSLEDSIVGSVRSGLTVLLGACALLLLIACVNVASLSVARATSRLREFATRSALGASRGQLVCFVLWEGLFVGLSGAVAGALLGGWATTALRELAARFVPRADAIRFDSTVFLFVALVAVACAIAVSMSPVRRRWRDDDGLRALRERSSTAASTARQRRRLVMAQLALAVVLVVGSGLLMKSLARLGGVESGVTDENGIVTMSVRPPATENGTAFALRMEELIGRVEAVPSVRRAAVALTAPADPSGWNFSLTIRDRPVPVAELPPIRVNVVSREYFETMGVPLLAGRGYERGDIASDEPVVILNRAAAERFWPRGSALDERILGDPKDDSGWARVIGVVGDIRQDLREPPVPEAFLPLEQSPVSSLVLAARVEGDPEAAAAALDPIVRAFDRDMPVAEVGTLAHRIGATLARPRFNATLMSVFAGIALVVASVGVYGVLAYSVAQRRHEIGIRMAVGADRTRVLGSVLREAAVIGAVGTGIGVVGAVALSRLIAGLLFEVAAVDPTVVGLVAAVTLIVSILAGLVPAWRATSIDPASILQEE